MSAIGRVCWTYFTVFPIQRWLGVVAVASLPLLIFRDLPWAFVVFLAWFIFLFAVVFVAGFLLRLLSAPRTHRFLPYFRAKMLAGTLAMLLLMSLPWLAFIWIVPPRALPAGSAFVYPFALLSAVVLGAFFVLSSLPTLRILLVLPAIILLPKLVDIGPPLVAATGLSGPMLVGLSCICAWTAFSVWYVRAPQMRPIAGLRPARIAQDLDSLFDRPGELTRDSAALVYLTARLPKRAVYWVLPAGILVPCALAIDALLGIPPLAAPVLLLAVPVVLMWICGALANRLARRARYVWLKNGGSRTELFVLTELEVRRNYLRNAVVVTLWILGTALLFPEFRRDTLLWTLAFCLASGLFASYLGLMDVRGFRLLEAAATLLVSIASIGVGAWAVFGQSSVRVPVMLGLLGFLLPASLACRTIAKRRWHRIDWLRFRPLRVPFQRLRAG